MWKKHYSVFDDHLMYVTNGIQKSLKVRIFCYTECIRDMFDIAQYLSPPIKKCEECYEANWETRYKQFTQDLIRQDTWDSILATMQEDTNYKESDY